jgi:hypothetical protein
MLMNRLGSCRGADDMDNYVIRRSIRALAVLVIACIALMANASAARAQGAQTPPPASTNHGRLHIVRKLPPTGSNLRAASGTGAPLCVDGSNNPGPCVYDYYGGPVISNVDVVVVYWGTGVSSVVDCGGGQDSQGHCIGVNHFFNAAVNSTFVDMLGEYNTAGVDANAGSKSGLPGTNQVIGRGTLHAGSPFIITPSAANSGSSITDSNIQSEIQSQIAAGHLPAPATDTGGNVNTIYMVYFPPGVTITDPNAGTSCVQFCAYHSTFNSSNLYVPYGVIPDFGAGSGCDSGCGTGTQWQNVISTSSHELAESVTDTAVGIGTTVDYPLAWYDANNGEIGDPCDLPTNSTNPLEYDSITYTVQLLFSRRAYNVNPNAGCVSPGTPSFTLTAPGSSPPGMAFDVTVTANNGDTSKYLGTVHFTSSDGTATLPVDYAFSVADGGTHTFPGGVTLNMGGADTVGVSDAHQLANAGTATVNVGKGSTTTSIGSAPNPSVYAQPVTFTATVTVTSGTPTGTVTFKNGTATLGTGSLSAGTAAFTTTKLTLGTHSITAVYSGDTNFAGSSSPALSQAVNQASSTTFVVSSVNPSALGQTVIFTATVKPANSGTPTGTVTFNDGTAVLGTGKLSGGKAKLSTSALALGSHSITAAYGGDANFTASTSATLTQTVN